MSTPPTAADTLARFADAIDSRDWAGLDALLAEGFRAHLVHTGESFDREAFVALNRDYPGAWRFVRHEVVDGGRRGVLRARVSPAEGPEDEVHFVASFGSVDAAGLLTELVEVWAEVVPAPDHERRPDLDRTVGGES